LRWAGHVALTGEVRNAYTVLVIKSIGREYVGDLDLDVRVIVQ
jgi:hypothetical protein